MRDLYERVLAERAARGVSADVPVEDILAVVERRGSEEERAATLNRLLATAEGRRELDLVRAAVRASQPSRTNRLRVPMAIAAVLLLAVVVRSVLRDEAAVDPMRGVDAGPIALHAPPESVTDLDSTRFVWATLPAANTYELELLDDAGNLIWTQTLSDTSAVLPDSVRLVSGRSYGWRVVAVTESGRVASALRQLRVLPR
jgi:hypothetical protein